MRFRDFWRSAKADNIFGFRFILGLCLFWIGPAWFVSVGLLMPRPAMAAWGGLAGAGWLLAWGIMIARHIRSEPGELVDLTPTVPMLLPVAMMVVGTFGALASV